MGSFLPVKRQRGEDTTIDNLPDEIVHGIFNSLDLKSLKNCAAVNKRFAEIVANSSFLLKGFKLKLAGSFWRSKSDILEVLSLKRKLQLIEISNVVGCHDVLVRIFKNFGCGVKTLVLSDVKIDDFTLREILKCSDSLESLVLSEVTIIKKLPAINPVSLRQLTHLTINHCDWTVVKFITAQIRSLTLKSYLDEGQKCNLINFLAYQCKLKELTLQGTSSKVLFQQQDVISNCTFDLEKFHIEHYFGRNSENVNWHISAFLSLHLETLKNVDISGPHCEHVIGFTVSNMERLESLVIDVRGLPKDEEFYDFMSREPNMVLKELSLRGFFVRHDWIKKILLKYPAIEKLELNDWGNSSELPEMLNFISENFPRLQKLTISEISNSNNVKFAALKNLTVTFIRNSDKLVKFIVQNSSIETVKVGLVYFEQISANFIDNMQTLKHVKHLAFGGNGKALKSILEQMKVKKPIGNLKSLELSLISEGKSATNSERNQKFYFPIENSTKFEL